MDTTTLVCSNPDCDVAVTKRCVEGLELTACPHFGRPRETTIVDNSDEATPTPPAKAITISLPPAGTLAIAQATAIRCARQSRVIAIVGAKASGKTSLIAGIYDLFQTGPIDSTLFARSRTLHAFEQACHDARAASRRGVPHTARTARGEVRFYHLDVTDKPLGDPLALLFGDRAGEEYTNIIDDHSSVRFPETRYADSIALLVDGDRLQDAGARHNLVSETALLLRALIEGEMIATGQHLALVLTKLDSVERSPNRDRAHRDFEHLAEAINEQFASHFASISTFAIAASPQTAQIARGTGVTELFTSWLKPQVFPATRVPIAPTTDRIIARLQR